MVRSGHATWIEGKGWVRTPLPESVSRTLAKSAALDAALAVPINGVTKPMSNTATALSDRIRRIRDAHASRLAESESRLATRLTEIDARSEAAVERLNAKLASDAAAQEAEVRALEDEVNQLTNGGPQLTGQG